MPQRAEIGISRRAAVGLVLLSAIFALASISFREGVGATAYETTDAAGRTMGFNDLFSHEHYRIILSNITLGGVLERSGFYELALFAAHAIMIVLLGLGVSPGLLVAFASLQFVCFPLGLLGFVYLPVYLMGVVRESADREAVYDLPFIPLAAHPVWLLVAGVIGWRAWRCARRARRARREVISA